MKKKVSSSIPINTLLMIAVLFLVFAIVAHMFVGMFKSEHAKERRELFTDACSTGMCSM